MVLHSYLVTLLKQGLPSAKRGGVMPLGKGGATSKTAHHRTRTRASRTGSRVSGHDATQISSHSLFAAAGQTGTNRNGEEMRQGVPSSNTKHVLLRNRPTHHDAGHQQQYSCLHPWAFRCISQFVSPDVAYYLFYNPIPALSYAITHSSTTPSIHLKICCNLRSDLKHIPLAIPSRVRVPPQPLFLCTS